MSAWDASRRPASFSSSTRRGMQWGTGAGTTGIPSDGGFKGKEAVLYRYTYAHCLSLGQKSATSTPSGSNPRIYPLGAAYPLVMIGRTKPNTPAEWKAAKAGCALGIVTAFSNANSPQTPPLCKHMAPWLPAKLPECQSS
jgi:hypothetical protein